MKYRIEEKKFLPKQLLANLNIDKKEKNIATNHKSDSEE